MNTPLKVLCIGNSFSQDATRYLEGVASAGPVPVIARNLYIGGCSLERHARNLASEGYDQDYIDEHKITIREVVIIASLIEKESAGGEESYDVSSVIYNRLEESSYPPYLNIDAAVIYGLGGNVDPVTGEVKPLTQADLQKDTPYNTYLHTGLTPGPICNPSQESLSAAVMPNETSYYFYVYNPKTYVHLFGKTAAEHEKNVNTVRSQGG